MDGDDRVHAPYVAGPVMLCEVAAESAPSTKQTSPIMLFFRFLSIALVFVAVAVIAPVTVGQKHALRNTQANSEVLGHIDKVHQSNDGSFLFGWACQKSNNDPIFVDVYGGENLWKRVLANKPSETGVANACGATGRNYRFSVPLTGAPAGLSVFVYGVINNDRTPLRNSGKFNFPKPPKPPATTSTIKGYIDNVSVSGGKVVVRGWACQTGEGTSIQIHIYAGGSAGSSGARLVKWAQADQNSEPAVAAACGTSFNKHRFRAELTPAQSASFQGESVYVHGISTKGTPNLAITKSGSFSFPSLPTTLSALGYSNPSTKDIVVPHGSTVTIDSNMDVGLILVQGKLQCPPGAGKFEIRTEGIVVAGQGAEFVCGASPSATSRVELSIVLKGNRDAKNIYGSASLGPKAVVAMNGGIIRLHGEPGREGFTYLQQTVQPGSKSIRLAETVQWKTGDIVVLAPTDFSPDEAEQRTIVSIAGNTVTLDRALTYKHWGETEEYSNGNGGRWTLDERAAVFVVNRNIRIGSADDSFTRSSAPTGGHFIVRDNGKAFVDNCEFVRMGQAGRMGRYPFHWHKLGSVSGQYIQNSSVHNSFQRCIVIHQSSYAKVISNTCYNHLGHGFFLEDGNEVKNQLIGNLGVLSRKPTKANALLASDIVGNNLRFAPTSTFWISHPNNLVRDNVAAGSEGSGFWMAFVDKTDEGVHPTQHPVSAQTWVFSNNKASSCLVGITHDGAPTGALTGNPNNGADRAVANAHYRPPSVPVFSNLVAFKCSEAGLYFRGERATYKNTILADNKRSVFFAYDQELIDSVVIGLSQNTPQSYNGPYFGALVYDGPLWLEKVHFAKFSHPSAMAIQKIGAAQLWTNQFRSLTFQDVTRRINSFRGDTGWSDEMCSAVQDVDGSLTGSAGKLVVPDHPWNADASRCLKPASSNFFTSLVCSYDVTYIGLEGNNLGFTSTRFDVASGDSIASISHTRTYRNKFSMIQGDVNQYAVTQLPATNGKRYVIRYFAATSGISSPLVQWAGFGGCSVRLNNKTIPKFQSISALRSQRAQGTVVQGSDLYIKFRTDANEATMRSDTYRGKGIYVLQC